MTGRPADIAPKLLTWYDAHARVLPWRAPRGTRADPYAVWLSEIMLQQTTVATVGPYFKRFLARWPTAEALAAASVEEVMKEWAGLGYYSRARNLHACAKAVAAAGGFPETVEALEELPGIGPYTAAAIAAIAFDRKATVVDGNVERVVARLFAVEEEMRAAKPLLREKAALLTPSERPGDFAQAMMDLGATICSPKRPSCGRCPLERECVARAEGSAETLPRRAPKKPKPTRHGACFWLERPDGTVLLRRRPPEGLLGGMMEVPTGAWLEAKRDGDGLMAEAPVSADWERMPGTVRHTFTHFHLELVVFAADASPEVEADGIWTPLEALSGEALPTVMRKVAAHALAVDAPLLAAGRRRR